MRRRRARLIRDLSRATPRPATPDRLTLGPSSLDRRGAGHINARRYREQECQRSITPHPRRSMRPSRLLAGASGLAKVLSGGTDLLVQMRSGRLKPELIVDTKKIPGIIGIREEGGGFVVGAATPGVMVERACTA